MKYSKPLSEMRTRLMESIPDNALNTETRAIVARIGALADQLKSLEQIAEHRNPTITEAAHAQKVHTAAQKLSAKIDSVQESIHAHTTDAARRLDEQRLERAGLKADNFAAEIRAAARSLKPAERKQRLSDAVEAGDAATVAALTEAPGITTSLDPQVTGRMRQEYLTRHAPDESAALDTLSDVVSSASKAIGVARAATKEAANPQFIREIQEASERAAKAEAGFTEALEA